MERAVGEGIGMGNTCKPMAVSFQCMTKSTTNKKKRKKKNKGEVSTFFQTRTELTSKPLLKELLKYMF